MSLLIAGLLFLQSGDIENVKPELRLAAIRWAGEKGTFAAVGPRGGGREDPEEKPDFKTEAQAALVKITGRTDLKDAAAWKQWWEKERVNRFPEIAMSSDELMSRVKEDLRGEMTKARQDIRGITTVLAVAIFLFIIVMFFFVGHVSSKIKGWLEMVRRDHEEGIARRSEDLGSELTHQMRMELQTLRQKAERELAQTVINLKTEIDSAARRAAAEVRDRLAK